MFLDSAVEIELRLFSHLRRRDLSIRGRKSNDLMSGILHRSGLMPLNMARIRADNALIRAQSRCDHRKIDLRPSHQKMNIRFFRSDVFPDLLRRFFAPEVQSVTAVAFSAALHQRFQYLRMRAPIVVIIKSDHNFSFSAFSFAVRRFPQRSALRGYSFHRYFSRCIFFLHRYFPGTRLRIGSFF